MANFEFLRQYWPTLADIASLAESYLYTDPNSSIMKMGMFAERLVGEIFIFEKIPFPDVDDTQSARVRILKREGLLPATIDNLLYTIRKKRNDATHEYLDSGEDAKTILFMGYRLACWFMEVYGDWEFSPPQFVLPLPPVDYAAMLATATDELKAKTAQEESLRADLASTAAQLASRDDTLAAQQAALAQNAATIAEREATLAAKEAEIAALQDKITAINTAASATTRQQRQKQSEQTANNLDATEAEVRLIIDEQLRAAGWEVDTNNLRYSKGTRPVKGRNLIIAEWPTTADDDKDGRVDYAMFIGLQMVGMIEAKRPSVNIMSVLDAQCKNYATHLRPEDATYSLGSWSGYRVPFLFAANGRRYFPQWPSKSGVWMKDTRKTVADREPLRGWPSPAGIRAWLSDNTGDEELSNTPYDVLRDPDGLALRDYQVKAIEAVEEAIREGKRYILVSMATGTGKTRVSLGLIFRLLHADRFRRILFLVDRNFLGEQAEDKFVEVRLVDFLTLSGLFPIKKLGEKGFDPETRLKITTVQSMVRLLDNPDASISVTDYDLIIVDEAHRGYYLNKEMSEAEILYRDEADYLSKYRQVIEYFDAVKVGLTATPALQTTEIFGKPVFNYTYREAVVDGWLIDHDLPHNLLSKLLMEGINYSAGETLLTVDPITGELLNGAELDDELHFDVDAFNKTVMTRPFTETMLNEVAKYIDPEGEGKTLIFAASDDHADMIVEILRGIYAEQGIPSQAFQKITASIGDQKEVRSAIRNYENERWPNVVVTVDLLTTGFDNPRITSLVFLRKVKSRILYEQMLGRATRRCDEIHKDHFDIFDCVRLYEDLSPYTNMKSVRTQESFAELIKGLEKVADPDMIRAQIQKIAAKLYRKNRFVTEKAAEHFSDMTGHDLKSFAEAVKTLPPDAGKIFVLNNTAAFELLDNDHPQRTGKIIDTHPDELISHTRGYGKGQKPEDYLESFGVFIRSNINEIEALKILCTRPSDLTREGLRSLKLELDRHSFSEQQLNSAWKAVTNQEITADIIAFIRQQALGSALISHEERIKRAFTRLRQAHSFTANQRNWLDRIEKTMLEEPVLDESIFDQGAFKTNGGFKVIDKRFGGTLHEVIRELNDYIYDDGGAA